MLKIPRRKSEKRKKPAISVCEGPLEATIYFRPGSTKRSILSHPAAFTCRASTLFDAAQCLSLLFLAMPCRFPRLEFHNLGHATVTKCGTHSAVRSPCRAHFLLVSCFLRRTPWWFLQRSILQSNGHRRMKFVKVKIIMIAASRFMTKQKSEGGTSSLPWNLIAFPHYRTQCMKKGPVLILVFCRLHLHMHSIRVIFSSITTPRFRSL